MKKHILHRVIRKLVNIYKRNEERILKESLAYCGNNTQIQAPFIVGHPELIEIGENTTILSDSRMQVYPENSGIEGHIKIGNGCMINYRDAFMAGADITIGNDVIIASDCCILSENHGFDPTSDIPYMDQKLICENTYIDDGTWLGHGVVVMPGVRIGKRCVIGANSVVTKDIPDYSIAVGSPARVIKTFDFDNNIWKGE